MIILLAICCVVLIHLMLEEIINVYKSIMAKKWPMALGELSIWSFRVDTDSEDSRLYAERLKYKYTVNNINYESDKIGFGFPQGMSTLYAEKAISRVLSEAPMVRVKYNKSNPSHAVLVAGVQPYHAFKLMTYVFGLFFCFLSAG